MRVLYFNNCWFTNVGEAFIDIGGMELVKRIFGEDCTIACLSAMSDYYCQHAMNRTVTGRFKGTDNNTFKISEYVNADYVIIPGMVGTLDYLKAPSRKMIDRLADKGCRTVFLGLGCERYDSEESEALKLYFDHIKPAMIMTRDNETYDILKNYTPCVKGIDCAFWGIDVFDPRGFGDKEYEIVAFNRTDEPSGLQVSADNIVRPWHMQYEYRKEKYRDKIFISDSPYDYMTLYANAKRVYTDLVHAAIISLMYGAPVKIWRTDKRSRALEALTGLADSEGWLSVSEDKLSEQKEGVMRELKAMLRKDA